MRKSMTKNDLIKQIKAKKAIIHTALDFLYIVGSKSWEQTFMSYIGPGHVDLDLNSSHITFTLPNPAGLVLQYKDPKIMNDLGVNLYKAVLCFSFNSIYEFIADYCELDKKNKNNWENAIWRPLARLVRNSFSHDFHFDFYDRYQKVMDGDVSCTFTNGRVFIIKNTEHEKELTGDNLPLDVIFLMIDEMISFAENLEQ